MTDIRKEVEQMGFMAWFLLFFAIIFIACIVIEILFIKNKKIPFAIAGGIAIVLWIAVMVSALIGFITSM